LLNGFNVFKGAIDDGIDLIAIKDNGVYKIQVKTCQDLGGYDTGRFKISVNLSTLTSHDPSNTFIVIVVHYLNQQISLDNAGNHNVYDQAFIILPSQKLFDFIGRRSGKVTVAVWCSLPYPNIWEDEGWIFKLRFGGRDLIADEYVFHSFEQITDPQ
jgi:hypothetical protein